jgi:hypothetical protein
VKGFFEIGSHKLFPRGWLWTTILLISASWVARITDVSHHTRLSKCLLRNLCITQSLGQHLWDTRMMGE